MGGVVSKEANDRWLDSVVPIKGEFRAFCVGAAASSLLLHENKFTLQFEREKIIYPLQRLSTPALDAVMWFLGQFCSADVMIPYFTALYWCLDKHKCAEGVWLIPISEIVNGALKWYYQVPRPGWVDPKIELKAWSHEWSFPSSHSQIIWALAAFFSGHSVGFLRNKLSGSYARTAFIYWYMLLGPYLLAALVSMSRVYEGLHYPRDVLAGAGVGVGIAGVYLRILPALKGFLGKMSKPKQILCLEVVALACIALVQWAQNKHKAEHSPDLSAYIKIAATGKHAGKSIEVHAVPLASYLGMGGLLTGLACVIPLLPLVPCHLPNTIGAGVARLFVGNIITLSTYFAVRVVEKNMFTGFAQALVRFFRYAQAPGSALLLSPWVFTKLGI